MSAIFIGARIYRGSSYGPRHPLSIPRVPTVMDMARKLGWLGEGRYRTSPQAKPAALETFHTAAHVAAVQKAETDQYVDAQTRERHGLGTVSNPVFPEMFRRPATASGGSMLGAELIRSGGVVFNPGGGTHHGHADRAAGFCYFNDPVLALFRLKDQGLTRILYIDIDAHHCDGVEYACAGDPVFRLISLHEAGRWPFTGRFDDTAGGVALNLPVPKGFNDAEFTFIWEKVLLPFCDRYEPQAIVLQSGSDALREDPLAHLALSNRCHIRAAQDLKARAPRLLVLGGGGYNPWTVGRCWTAVWGTLAGFDLPDRLAPDVQDSLRALSWSRRGRPSSELLETLVDAPRNGPIRPEVMALVEAAMERVTGIEPVT